MQKAWRLFLNRPFTNHSANGKANGIRSTSDAVRLLTTRGTTRVAAIGSGTPPCGIICAAVLACRTARQELIIPLPSGRSDQRHEVRKIALPHLRSSRLAEWAGILESLHGPRPPRRSKTRGKLSGCALSPSPANDPVDPRRRAGRPLAQGAGLSRAITFWQPFVACAVWPPPWLPALAP
jgi:hypothetical protein